MIFGVCVRINLEAGINSFKLSIGPMPHAKFLADILECCLTNAELFGSRWQILVKKFTYVFFCDQDLLVARLVLLSGHNLNLLHEVYKKNLKKRRCMNETAEAFEDVLGSQWLRITLDARRVCFSDGNKFSLVCIEKTPGHICCHFAGSSMDILAHGSKCVVSVSLHGHRVGTCHLCEGFAAAGRHFVRLLIETGLLEVSGKRCRF